LKKLLLFLLLPLPGHTQNSDTLVDAGGYKLHFIIVRGAGIPILFEAGGGDDASVWTKLVKPISTITGSTLIMYDRPGFGKSGLDTNQHGILNGVKGLEIALHTLGYDRDIMLVAHSQGAFTATVYASRHAAIVKAAVLIDASTACWFDKKRVAVLQAANDREKEKFKATRPGLYYQLEDLTKNVAVVEALPFPTTIPLTDFVSGNPPFRDSTETADWRRCHAAFVSASSKRTGIVAYESGHYIFEDNRPLVVMAIAKAYATISGGKKREEILQRAMDYSINTINETKNEETAFRHSADDLNGWGYKLSGQGKIEQALEVFKLNVELHPGSWNVYDSYGEALLKNGQKKEAIKMYQRSVELNSKSEHGKKVLEGLLQGENKN
jgi:pimeloyl-ACP methyl ester carboxylesterase